MTDPAEMGDAEIDALLSYDPQTDGGLECGHCGTIMMLDSESDEPTSTCHGCAQELFHTLVPALLARAKAAEKERDACTEDESIRHVLGAMLARDHISKWAHDEILQRLNVGAALNVKGG